MLHPYNVFFRWLLQVLVSLHASNYVLQNCVRRFALSIDLKSLSRKKEAMALETGERNWFWSWRLFESCNYCWLEIICRYSGGRKSVLFWKMIQLKVNLPFIYNLQNIYKINENLFFFHLIVKYSKKLNIWII